MANTPCPCGKKLDFLECCGTFIIFGQLPKTAEELMRSRYSAFATKAVSYLAQTILSPSGKAAIEHTVSSWINSVESWTKLDIRSVKKGGPNDTVGWVEFKAHFIQNGRPDFIWEKSMFKKIEGKWVYLEVAENHP